MSLSLKVSHSLESLAAALARNMQASGHGIFVPFTVVTQTDGMNIWLRQQLALRIGIAANISFLKPNDIIFKLYQLLDGKYEESLSRENLIWLLYELMGKPEFTKRYPQQAEYFNTAGAEKDLKRMGLAEKVADLFDQYQIYRQELITEWNSYEIGKPDLHWQAYLWIRANDASNKNLPDKTVISKQILENISQETLQERIKDRLPAIHLFGLSIITKYHLQILYQVAAVTDVYFYLLNPAPDIYWIEDRSEKQVAIWRSRNKKNIEDVIIGNPLLTNWGRVLQHTYSLLFRMDETLNDYTVEPAAEPVRDTLLHKVQYDIYHNLTEDRSDVTEADLQDGTVSFHANYTIVREVESLYNYLVHLVDKKKEKLSPRDIVVMVSDIDKYAPYIRAVFDNAPYYFRYQIADISVSQGDNIYSILQQILELNADNFTAENVMQLLDSSYVQARFQLGNTARLRSLVDAANIRFGMDGNQDDETYTVSWRYGLQRLMYGLCMSGEVLLDAGDEPLYPLDRIEGNESQDVVRFCHFVQVLMSSIEERKRNRTIGEWVAYVQILIQDLIFWPENSTDEDFADLQKQLAAYTDINGIVSEKVGYNIFKYNFVQTLNSTQRNSLYINDGITFCSLIPMRSIPFKIIAMLGLNNNSFPRHEKRNGLNLMLQQPQLGDRNIKDNDKHLFLETILSAKDYLYLSYIGRSVRDNAEKPPSILVDELLDYIRNGIKDDTVKVENYIVTQYPLQSFSRKYNDPKFPRLYKYTTLPSLPAKDLITPDKKMETMDFDTIALDKLYTFFKNPIQSYYNQVLGIYYGQEDSLLAETEIFSLDGLQKWQLKNEVLSIGSEEELFRLRQEWTRKGRLPLKSAADITIENTHHLISPLRDAVTVEKGGAAALPLTYSIPLDDTVLTGVLDNVFEGKYVYVSFSPKSKLRNMMQSYLNLLVGRALGAVDAVVFVQAADKEGDEMEIIRGNISDISQAEALHRLQAIVEFYQYGLRQKVVFGEFFLYDAKKLPARDSVTEVSLEQKVMRAAEDTRRPLHDAYLRKEYECGLFQKPDIAVDFLRAYDLVLAPLDAIFFP